MSSINTQLSDLTMKYLLLLALAATALADDTFELGDSDFDSKLADMETALVMFYAPWYVSL